MTFAHDMPYRISLLERLLAAAVLFYGAMLLCLPVPPTEEIAALYPWWGKRIAIGNVQLYELLFVLWLVLYGRRFVPRALLQAGIPARQAAIWLTALAVWCGLISLLAPLPLLDLGRTLRLLLNVALLFAIVRWTRQHAEFPLTVLLLGFACGSIVNLVLSFRFPLIVLETMRLSGQNTAGVVMGVAIHLAAWLFFRSRHARLRLLAVGVTGLFAFGCAISYSRIGWAAGGCGMLAWGYVLVAARAREPLQRRRLRRMRLIIVPLLFLAVVQAAGSSLGQEGFQWLVTLGEQKFGGGPSEGDTNRWAYAVGTGEIVMSRPFGVGYSGFFDAMTATDVYRSGIAAEEESPLEANPHATVLWYTAAGGIPAALMTVLLLAMLLNSMRWGLVADLGRPGLILFMLAALPFLVMALTVPYLFNSIVLIGPAAIAAGWGWTQLTARSAQTNSVQSA